MKDSSIISEQLDPLRQGNTLLQNVGNTQRCSDTSHRVAALNYTSVKTPNSHIIFSPPAISTYFKYLLALHVFRFSRWLLISWSSFVFLRPLVDDYFDVSEERTDPIFRVARINHPEEGGSTFYETSKQKP
jgi:hypothetical protein